MTSLGCNAKSCTHNKDNLCCLSMIQVDGSRAEKTEDTCCRSYYEQKPGWSNSVESPKASLNISCRAETCSFNDHCECHADHINISGICACDADGTVCATYEKKQ